MDLSFEQFQAKHWDAVYSFCRRIHSEQSVAFWLTIHSFDRLRTILQDMPADDYQDPSLLVIARHECMLYARLRRRTRHSRLFRIGRWILNYILLERWARRIIFGKNKAL